MPKKQEKKTAKGRLDKFYHLAKQQGFRSRAAFKLVQLNKKYNFLESARCCIDLCAAPGGWLQVASKQMAPGSLIVGVDLVPIKPIPRCITFAEDINSFKCRDQLRAELKDWKADVVLHDGAPNVGTAWVQDAYAQSELVLQSLKLAVEFLAPGGVFVTKVFRSKDYNNLLWVFNQLFRKVEATKPPSSRNVSAEIFVVCQEFKAPKRIDPKFLDPRHVFKDLDPTSATGVADSKEGDKAQTIKMASNAVANVFEPEKKRRKREGYAEGEMILFKAIGAKEFIETGDPVAMLGTYNEIQFKADEDKRFLDPAKTDANIRACCEDLKVLGKKDFRNLLKWRKDWRDELALEAPKGAAANDEDTEKVEVEPVDEEELIDEELTRIQAEKERRQRKERRRRNEERQKRVLKMQLSMTTPMDIGMDIQDEALQGEEFFNLQHGGASRRVAAGEEAEGSGDEGSVQDRSSTVESDVDPDAEEERRLDRLEGEVDGMYEEYQQRLSERDAKHRVREARKANKNNDEWYGFKDDAEQAGSDAEEQSDAEGSDAGFDALQRRKMQEETYDTDDEEDDAEEREMREAMDQEQAQRSALKRKRDGDVSGVTSDDDEDGEFMSAHSEDEEHLLQSLESKDARKQQQSREAAIWFDNPLFKAVSGLEVDDDDDDDDDEDEEDEEDSDEEDNEDEELSDDAIFDEEDGSLVDGEVSDEASEANTADEQQLWRFEDDDEGAAKQKQIEDKGLTTAEAITLASQLVNREKTATDLIDDGFTKHNFVDKTDLPKWFLDDEGKYYKSNVPVTKEAVDALKARQRALDARPIKKVAEAKARKKMRVLKRMETARKKAEGITDNVDISEREKAANIEKILRRAGKTQQRKPLQVVVARGANKGSGRPKGVKGRYRMVDRRGKKELRAQKRRDKKAGKKTNNPNARPRIPNGYSKRI